jgi:CRP-like cAMP-binding protein
MPQVSQSSIENRLLAALSPADFKAILPYLEWYDLKLRDTVYEPDEIAKYAYFPVSGICSVIALTGGSVKSETGIIGREGFVGSSIVLYAGSSLLMSSSRLREGLCGFPKKTCRR